MSEDKKYCARCKKEAKPPYSFGCGAPHYCGPCAMDVYNSRPCAGLVAIKNPMFEIGP